MNNYQDINLEISKLIKSLKTKNLDSFKKKLQKQTKNIFVKEWKDSNLVMILNYSNNKKSYELTSLERECRSLIIDKNTLEIICYTYDDIYYNQDAKNYLINNSDNEYLIQECFEGTFISVFYYDNKWYLSTRKCIDAKSSIWNNEKSYYELFVECLDTDFDSFCEYLNEENNYYFILLHHENKNIVDYSKYFGKEDYKEIIHVMTRARKGHREFPLIDDSQWKIKPQFIIPKNVKDNPELFNEGEYNKISTIIENNNLKITKIPKLNDYTKLDEANKHSSLDLPVLTEGLIVKMYDNDSGKIVLLKFQTNSYRFLSILKPSGNNMMMNCVELYKNDYLSRHVEYFPGNAKFQLNNQDDNYDTIGVVDATFKVMTSELFELFRHLYNLKDCSHKNSEYYNTLPSEYTIALYKIRGIYYKKKELYIRGKTDEEYEDESKSYVLNSGLRIYDIYNMLKYQYETKELLKLFRARKLMIYKCQMNKTDDLIIFENLSHRCDKVSVRMANILLNKMFPTEPDLNIEYDNSVVIYA